MCSGDDQCPGFGGDASHPFCVAGACAQCRSGSNGDCSGTTPVCDAGACRACRAHSECAAGVCKSDGRCASESEIAYVEPSASDTADCSRATKCSLTHGISIGRPFVLLATGTYTLNADFTLQGTISLVGGSMVKPELTRSTAGPTVKIGPGSDVTLDNVRLRGATGGSVPTASGLYCINTPIGARHVRLIDFDSTQNQYDGVYAQACAIDALRSTFTNNAFTGVDLTDSNGTFDRCLASGNGNKGSNLDTGLFMIRNNFVYRNGDAGIVVYGNTGTVAEFNTVIDNAGGGMQCTSSGLSFPNNLVVRNGAGNTGGCTFPGSIIAADTTGLSFKSADAAPYDYHITAGSIAIDQATISTVMIDFDGDARPQGNGKDVGADEFRP